MKKLQNLQEVENFLNKQIPQMTGAFLRENNLGRVKHFLELLGNPQEKVKVIHIAGTSGKGSTATFIDTLLRANGFKTGLHLSPHILDIREKCQVDGRLLAEEKFVEYFNEILSYVKKVNSLESRRLTYFEMFIGLTFYIFAKEKVDYAIIETGLGGRYDGTNIVSRRDKLSVLTKIGIDHTDVLGKTIEEITDNKVGIIQEGNTVVATNQSAEVEKIITKTCQSKNAELHWVRNWEEIKINLPAEYQKENGALALRVVSILSQRDDFSFDEGKASQIINNTYIIGRFDIQKKDGKTLILDGAHNPQKMEAFISSLKRRYPNKKFVFLVAFKNKKDFSKMLEYIIPVASKAVVITFVVKGADNVVYLEKNKKVVDFLKKKGYNNYEVVDNLGEVLDAQLKSDEKEIVITGSLYLVANVYRWLKLK